MRKIFAISMILCLGILIVPNVQSGNSGELVIMHYNSSALDNLIDNTSDSPRCPVRDHIPSIDAPLRNMSESQTRYIIYLGSFAHNSTEITKVEFKLNISTVNSPGNISCYKLVQNNASVMRLWQTNWTYANNLTTWENPGGDFNQMPLDTKFVNTPSNVTFDITGYINESYSSQYGLIFIADFGSDFAIESLYNGMNSLNIYYTTSPGAQSTNITANKWTWLGYLNSTSKTGAQLYSEISSCQYVVMQNTTTGYYYTYGPGIEEDFTITYGAAVALLASADTNWSHK